MLAQSDTSAPMSALVSGILLRQPIRDHADISDCASIFETPGFNRAIAWSARQERFVPLPKTDAIGTQTSLCDRETKIQAASRRPRFAASHRDAVRDRSDFTSPPSADQSRWLINITLGASTSSSALIRLRPRIGSDA